VAVIQITKARDLMGKADRYSLKPNALTIKMQVAKSGWDSI
jgi:hypothetical protein